MNLPLRTNTLFEQIIREEYINAKVNQIKNTHFDYVNEQKLLYTKTRVDPEYAKNPKHPWTGNKKQAWSILTAMGAQPWSNGINPDGLELTIYNQKGIAQDRMSFDNDGTVYISDTSTKLDWAINGSVVNIKSGSTVVGSVQKINGKPQYIESADSKTTKSEKEKQEKEDTKQRKEYESGENKVIDNIQSVLDYAGVIPIIGDALDVINAAIYFIRGKWFDGILSLIAIFPIVGSALSIGIKGAKSTLKIGKNVPTPTELSHMWKTLIDNKILKKEEIATAKKWFKIFSNKTKSVASGINQIPVLTEAAKKSLIAALHEFDKFLYETGESLAKAETYKKAVEKTLDFKNVIAIASKRPDLINKLSKRLEFNPWTKGSATEFIAKTVNPLQWGKMLAKVPGLGVRMFANAPWFSAKKLALLNKRMIKTFTKQMSDPHLLVSVLETVPDNKAFRNEVNEIIRELSPKFKKINIYAFHDIDNITKKIIGTKYNAEGAINWLSDYKTLNPKSYNILNERLINLAIERGSGVWAAFQRDAINQLKAVFSKDLANPFKSKQWGEWLEEAGANVKSWRKWYDVIFSEIEDTMESFGIINQDEANGFISDLIINKIQEKFPEAYKTISNTKQDIEQSPTLQYAKNRAKEKLTTTTYDPSSANQGGIYNK